MRTVWNSVKFENVYWKCYEGCNTTNEEKLQALIDKTCVDYLKVNLKPLDSENKESVTDILNFLVSEIVKLKTKVNSQGVSNSGSTGTNQTSIDISKISLCGRDNSTYTYQECLLVLNECFPTLSIEAIMSAIVKRLNAHSYWIQQIQLLQVQHGNDIQALITRMNQLEARINSCCP